MGVFTSNKKYDLVNDKKSTLSYEFWQPGTSHDYSLGGGIVPSGGWDYEEFMENLYEVLRASNPKYITRVSLGLDESGTHAIYKYIFEPENGYEKTIILSSGTHGNEYTGSYGLYELLRRIAGADNFTPYLNYLRNYVRIIVIPVLNPWGFTNNRRQNINGVDLNRGSSYNWSSYTKGQLYLTSTPTSATTLTLTDTSQSWSVNAYAKKNVVITSGTGSGQSSYVESNTSDTLTFQASREFAIAPDETSTYQIMDIYYKGTSAWSEAEGVIYKNLIDSYPNATTSLDFHTISSVSAQYIMYSPRFMNNFNHSIRDIILDKYVTDERVVWGTSTLPTLTNYCCNEYGMFGGNPEFCNKRFSSTSRDATEMERCIWWFGNIAIAAVSQKGRGSDITHRQQKIKHLKYDTFDAGVYSLSRQSTNTEIRGVALSSDGSYLFALDNYDNTVRSYVMSEEYNLDSMSATGDSYSVDSETGSFAQDVYIASNDNKFFVLSSSNINIVEYSMTGGDLTTATPNGNTFDVSTEFSGTNNPTGLSFSLDGSKMYVCGDENTIAQYDLNTAWDLSDTTTINSTLDVTNQDETPRAVDVCGDYLYMLGEDNETVYAYDLDTTTFSSSTPLTSNFLDVSDKIGLVSRVCRIDPTGTKLYVLGTTRNVLHQYNLVTANDVSTFDGVEPEYVYLESDNSQKTIWSGLHEFNINTTCLINVRGTITVRADEDCTIEMLPFIYQPFNPEFGWTDTKSRVEYFKQRVTLQANVDTAIPINGWIHGAPVNIGMNDGVYGIKRVAPVKLRPRCNSLFGNSVRVFVREYRITVEIIPTEIGSALELYDASNNMKASSSDIDANGEAPVLKYPNPDFFNVDNYNDGDGDEDAFEDDSDDEA